MLTIARSVNFGTSSTGLSTVGYTLYNADGSINAVRTIVGVTEILAGTGIYKALISFDETFNGHILWDTGEVDPSYADEDFSYLQYLASASTAATISTDITTDIGKVRSLINDIDATEYQLLDSQITYFVSISDGDTLLAASYAMLAIASSSACLAKRKTAGNYSEDLTAIARECREAAKMFKEMAVSVPAEAISESFFTDFNYNELLRNKSLRGEYE